MKFSLEISGQSVLEGEITRAKALVISCREERNLLRKAYGWPCETAPEGWNEEANKKHLWKMFK